MGWQVVCARLLRLGASVVEFLGLAYESVVKLLKGRKEDLSYGE